jgi:hypothetical protein
MDKADQIASAYIVSLWGARRRAFARRFWLHLTCDRPRPDEDCFGAQRIKRHLDRIWREIGQHWWHD